MLWELIGCRHGSQWGDQERFHLEGQRNHPHHQTTLTEKRKGQLESEVETEDLIGPGMWNIEVPGLAKEVQPVVLHNILKK